MNLSKIINNEYEHPMDRLTAIMDVLRSETGCPWDREQDHKSLIPCLLEESYEVVEAIEKEDMSLLKEELGDLLFQSVFHSQLAKEKKYFDLNDVIQGISEKLIRRHPHVFAKVEGVNSAERVVEQWEAIKKEEKKQSSNSPGHSNHPPSVLDSVPISLPGIQMADKIQSKVSKLGFDWENWQEPIQKLWEEVDELKQELNELSRYHKDEKKIDKSSIPKDLKSRIESEMGDVFFSLVNVARHIGIDPETAIRHTNHKFSQRFRYIESESAIQGKNLKEMSLSEMDELWNQAKSKETSHD